MTTNNEEFEVPFEVAKSALKLTLLNKMVKEGKTLKEARATFDSVTPEDIQHALIEIAKVH